MTAEQAEAVINAHWRLVNAQMEHLHDELTRRVLLTQNAQPDGPTLVAYAKEHRLFPDEAYQLEDAFPFLQFCY